MRAGGEWEESSMTLRGVIVGCALGLAGPGACVPTGLADDGCDELEYTPCVAWPGTEGPSREAPQERLDAWREHMLVLRALGCEGWIVEAEGGTEAPVAGEPRAAVNRGEEVGRARPLDRVERDV